MPVPAAVVGAVDVRLDVLEAVAVDGRVGGLGVEVRGLQDADLGPRGERRRPGRRHVGPVRPLVPRAPDQAVVGAHPEVVIGQPRRRDGIDHAEARAGLRVVRRGRRVEVGRRARILAREVGADRRPVLAAVLGAEETLAREVEHARIARREHQRQRPGLAVEIRIGQRGIDRPGLPGAQVEPLHPAAEEHVRVLGVGSDVVALAARRRLAEHGEVDAVVGVGAAGHTGGAGILLRAVHPVGKAVVGDHVVELAGRLVEPGAPGLAAVGGHHRPLVDAEDAPLRAARIDPELVVVVAAGRALDRHEGLAGIVRAVHGGVAGVDDVGIAGIDRDAAEVPAAPPDPVVAARPRPGRAGVVRAVQPAVVHRVHHGVDAARPARRHGEADASRLGGQAMAGDLRPVIAAVRRLVEAAAGTVGRRVDVPRGTAGLPQGGVEDLRVPRLEGEVDRSGVVVLAEHLLPAPAAVAGAEHAALRVGAVGVPQRRRVDDVRIARIDQHAPDLLRVGEADMGPGLAAVGGLVHAVPLGDVGAHVGLAAPDVDHPWVGGRDGQRADRADRLRIEDRLPGAAGVAGLPHAAVDAAEVEMLRLLRHAGHRQHAPAAERAEQAPVQVLEQRGIGGRGGRGGKDAGAGQQEDGGEQAA